MSLRSGPRSHEPDRHVLIHPEPPRALIILNRPTSHP